MCQPGQWACSGLIEDRAVVEVTLVALSPLRRASPLSDRAGRAGEQPGRHDGDVGQRPTGRAALNDLLVDCPQAAIDKFKLTGHFESEVTPMAPQLDDRPTSDSDGCEGSRAHEEHKAPEERSPRADTPTSPRSTPTAPTNAVGASPKPTPCSARTWPGAPRNAWTRSPGATRDADGDESLTGPTGLIPQAGGTGRRRPAPPAGAPSRRRRRAGRAAAGAGRPP